MKSTIKCISATLLFVSTCAQPASAPEEKPPEGDRIALAFVEDSSLFASAMAKIDLGPFDELLKKGEVTIEDVYEGPGFVINKFPLQGWGHRGSNEYVFGPSVRRREGIPHWKLVYQKYWCLHCDPNISDTFGIRRIDPSQFPFFELTNKSPEAERKQNGWDFSIKWSKFEPLAWIQEQYQKKHGTGGSNPEFEGIYVDILPVSPETVRGFVLWEGIMRAWEGKYAKDKNGKWYTEWDAKRWKT